MQTPDRRAEHKRMVVDTRHSRLIVFDYGDWHDSRRRERQIRVFDCKAHTSWSILILSLGLHNGPISLFGIGVRYHRFIRKAERDSDRRLIKRFGLCPIDNALGVRSPKAPIAPPDREWVRDVF